MARAGPHALTEPAVRGVLGACQPLERDDVARLHLAERLAQRRARARRRAVDRDDDVLWTVGVIGGTQPVIRGSSRGGAPPAPRAAAGAYRRVPPGRAGVVGPRMVPGCRRSSPGAPAANLAT